MDEMSIGEFARRSRLSPKALRLYDELGLLAPVRVDDSSATASTSPTSSSGHVMVAALRQLQMPLAEIKAILELEPAGRRGRLAEYWAGVESEHSARRRLAGYLVDRINGKRSVMYVVSTREVPARSLLCLKRNVAGWDQAWALGKEFVALRSRPLPRVGGKAGRRSASIGARSARTATARSRSVPPPSPMTRRSNSPATFPELTLRTEPAHREAFVSLGQATQVSSAQWQLVSGVAALVGRGSEDPTERSRHAGHVHRQRSARRDPRARLRFRGPVQPP